MIHAFALLFFLWIREIWILFQGHIQDDQKSFLQVLLLTFVFQIRSERVFLEESLDSLQIELRPFCLTAPDAKCECLKYPELFDVYSILMRIAILATGYEIQDLLR